MMDSEDLEFIVLDLQDKVGNLENLVSELQNDLKSAQDTIEYLSGGDV